MNFRCPECKTPVTSYQYKLLEEVDYVTSCRSCDETLMVENIDVTIAEDCKKFEDIKTVRDTTWFHITTVEPENWKCDDKFTHIGTLATTRAYKRYNYKSEKVRTFQFRLLPGTIISNEIFEDCNAWQELEYAISLGEFDVVRYINRYESPGQISLLGNPAALDLVRVGRLH